MIDKMQDDASARFINALVKSVQSLCHGYLDFDSRVQIIGHINLSVDEGTSLDYILKEKVCKNAENSTMFISNSFHAEPKPEPETQAKDSGNQSRRLSDSEDTGRVGSAISSISTALSRDRKRRGSGSKDDAHSNSVKRKMSEDGGGGSDSRPSRVPPAHDNSHSSSSQSPFPPTSTSPVDSKEGLQEALGIASDANMSEMLLPQTANVSDSAADIGVNLAGSVLEPVDDHGNADFPEKDEDSDGDLEVTFIKEEYVEGERSACEYGSQGQQQFMGGQHQRASDMQDPSMFPGSHHSSSAPATYVPGNLGDASSASQQFGPSGSQPGPSGMRGLQKDPRWTGSPCLAPLVDRSRKQHFPTLVWNQSTSFKKLQCKYCSAVFTSNGGLLKHRNLVHLGISAYSCNVCGKKFNSRQHFEGHMNKHNNIKAYTCPNCSASFAYKTSLDNHVRFRRCSKTN